jgi:hypothetical protein
MSLMPTPSPAPTSSQDRWDTPLTLEERDALIEKWVESLRKRGLVTPVLFALEMHRPLGFLASQGMIVGAPFAAPLVGIEKWQDASRLLGDREAVKVLIQKLEDANENIREETV